MASGAPHQNNTRRIPRAHGQTTPCAPGYAVIVRDDEYDDCYGAVISHFDGDFAHLTFTPEGRPTAVPLSAIAYALTPNASAAVDPTTLSTYQPPATPPRRRHV